MSETEINFEGSQVIPSEVPEEAAFGPDTSGILRIREMISNPEVPTSEISRAIALTIATVMAENHGKGPLDRGRYAMADMGHHVKALRELQKTLTESDLLSRRDSLNLDGEKFKFVLQQILEWFQRALKDAGVKDDLAKNVMQQFRDLVKSNEETLRKDVSKI